jgi:hypothetical protein
MTYEVQTWDEEQECVKYYRVEDAIDYDDAKNVIKHLHPEQKVISVVKK